MKTNANQNTSTIYYRPLKQWIEVTPEQKRDWERFVGTTRKAKQRAGACCIPYKKSYKCDGLCDTCEFRCIPKDAPQHLSIDTEMENACENGVSRTSFLADSGLTTEIDIDAVILNFRRQTRKATRCSWRLRTGFPNAPAQSGCICPGTPLCIRGTSF